MTELPSSRPTRREPGDLPGLRRRGFLAASAGVTAAAGLVLAGCGTAPGDRKSVV